MRKNPQLADRMLEDEVTENVSIHESYYIPISSPPKKGRQSPVKRILVAKANLFIEPDATSHDQTTWMRICVQDLLPSSFKEGSMRLEQNLKWADLDKQVRAKLGNGTLFFEGETGGEMLGVIDNESLAGALTTMKERKEDGTSQAFMLLHMPA